MFARHTLPIPISSFFRLSANTTTGNDIKADTKMNLKFGMLVVALFLSSQFIISSGFMCTYLRVIFILSNPLA